MKARHESEMLGQDLTAQIDAAEQDVSEKSATRAEGTWCRGLEAWYRLKELGAEILKRDTG